MSAEQVAAAVERIQSDPAFAAAVLREPEATLTAEFDLEPNEWRAIHHGLAQDASRAIDFSRVQWSGLRDIGTAFGNRTTPTVIPGERTIPTVIPGEQLVIPTVIPAQRTTPTVIPGEQLVIPTVIPAQRMTPTVIPAVEGIDAEHIDIDAVIEEEQG